MKPLPLVLAAFLFASAAGSSAQEGSTSGSILLMPPNSSSSFIVCQAATVRASHCQTGLMVVPLMEFVALNGYKRVSRRGFAIQGGIQFHVLQVE